MSEGHTEVTTAPVAAPVVSCADECGVRDVQDRLGDKWTVHVVVELAPGPRRFRELQRLVTGVSQRMLTLTLRRLERDGLVSRTVYPTTPPQVEYALTETGQSMTHLIKQLVDWSLDHRAVIARSREEWDTRTARTA
ncbi:helix-turn-helix domain-containing protein [Streptomyces sp. WAC01280]|uniref:winged helix-turn-helix transcriptional regulator n=1 Tax=Streptomyces sp. WAC01280 TaxID=2487424 RepID=UPI000F76F877|nr:helix-turn-helix domain-containing protein [Streptomyces sp. WAC01280]RSS54248.1 transcriptional regulator [Streptomyces sp. WAC01280]